VNQVLRHALIFAVLSIFVAVGGCGSDEDDKPATPAPPTSPKPVPTAQMPLSIVAADFASDADLA
jgi:hypothetical protein